MKPLVRALLISLAATFGCREATLPSDPPKMLKAASPATPPSELLESALTTPSEPIFQVGGDVVAPRPLKLETPEYGRCPPGKRGGIPIVEALIDTNGRVISTRVMERSNPCLGEAMAEALKRSRFRPATRNGQPVAVRFTITASIRWSR